MAIVWRRLFENLEFRLLGRLRWAKLPDERAKLYESAATVALAGAADILRTADITGDADADAIWRTWNDFPFSFEGDTPYPDIMSRLQRTYNELSACTVAWLLRQGIRIENAPDTRRRVLETARRRLSGLETQQPIANVVPELLNDEESIASTVWDEWMLEEAPEREVIWVESLRTGLFRLSVLSLIISGPLEPESSHQSMRFIQEHEIRVLAEEVLRAFEASEIQLTSTPIDSVLEYFRTMRRLASRAHAIETLSHPISDELLDAIRTSATRGWTEARELRAVLESAGCKISAATATMTVRSPRVPRTFLVEDTEPGRQERWIGVEAGRAIARGEMARAVNHWMQRAKPMRRESSLEGLLPQMAERVPLVLLLPDDWRTQVAARGNRALAEAEVHVISTPSVPDDAALLIWAAEENWRLGYPEDVSITYEELELSADDEDAYVILNFDCGRPEAAGEVQVIRLHPDQVASHADTEIP